MNARWRQRLHLALRALGWSAGIVVVALAVLVALAQLLLPLLARHPQWVAAQLSERLHRPVRFASMEGYWRGSGPLFVMRDVTIGPGPGGGSPLRLPESQLKIDFGSWLLPSRHLLDLRARGLELELSHDAQGRWHVNGIGGPQGGARQDFSMGPVSLGIWLRDLRLVVTDEASGRRYAVLADQLRLSRQGDRVRFGVVLQREGTHGQWHGAGSFHEDGSAGQLWLAGDRLDLRALLGDVAMDGYTAKSGSGNLAAWLDWQDRKLVHATLRFDLANLTIEGPAGTARVPALRGLAGISQRADGYDVRYTADDGGALAIALHQPDGPLHVGLVARNLELAPLLPWLALKPDLSPGLGAWLGGGHPRARIMQAALQWSRADGVQYLQAAFAGAGIDAVGKLPGISRLDGHLRGDAEGLALEWPAQATVIDLAGFRNPLALSRLAGTVAAWHADGAWQVGVDPLVFEGEGYAGSARGTIGLPDDGGRPFLDLYAHVDHAQVVAAKQFWPVHSMSPHAIQWLDRALVAGTVDEGDLVVRGSLADWPFHHNEGRFEAHARISGLTLDYGADWPQASGVDVEASFVDNGMLAEARGGQSLGIKLDHAVALIPDFSDTTVDLNAQGSGSGASLLAFLQQSPIARHEADTLAKLRLGGSGTFGFHLSLPVKDAKAMRLEGSAQLKDMDVDAPEWRLALGKLGGPVSFDAHGVHAGPLAGSFRGQPSSLDLAIADATGRPGTVLSARLQGRYAIGELVQGYPQLEWLGAAAEGRSDYTLGLDIAHGSGDTLVQTLSADSTLAGTTLKLPVPLSKSAGGTLPLHLTLGLPVNGASLEVAMGEVMRARFRLPTGDTQSLAATIAFGDAMPDSLPDKGLRIRGHAAELDVSGWVQHAVAGSSGNGPGLESIDVSADRALVFEHDFPNMHIKAVPEPDALSIDADSPALAGHVDVPATDLRKRGITARLQRLYWTQVAPQPAAGKPAKGGQPKGAASGQPPAATAPARAEAAANPAATGIDPASLPPFHLWVGDLRLGAAKLGEARLETWPTAQGMHIDQLRALSRSVQLNAGGDWNGDAQDSHTHMRIDFSAQDLGSMLTAFGYEGLFTGGKTHAVLDARWPGAPTSFALPTMDGTLGIDVSNGRIPEVGPGVGRLFGLVSVAELPRRLTLDFGDVFGKGLGFDSIKGDFRFADGNATTDNLKIRGPAADIDISGRTGLRARDYDQQVYVMPHVGNSLPVVGAVVAGPVGAAAGFAVQGLLGKGLNKAASARYHVSGSWEKPVFTLVEKHEAQPAAPSSAPAPATSTAH
ncbi:YhdP family protein [Frateuria terrea]|uniref:TIGR02099 family protein n=1 Tax=Frateuria terrea TaxID=529704 RepID=A0A1H6ZMM0_9GAMM|nr:YhdP family protein [Frateuria terrea]SEJ53414.1 TIGR02099 family protein [Frateuria terrea]SFP80839.1 TIGR02099 family protein [Frateuria terrea]